MNVSKSWAKKGGASVAVRRGTLHAVAPTRGWIYQKSRPASGERDTESAR